MLDPQNLQTYPVAFLFVKASDPIPQSTKDDCRQPQTYIPITQSPQRREAFLIPVHLQISARPLIGLISPVGVCWCCRGLHYGN